MPLMVNAVLIPGSCKAQALRMVANLRCVVAIVFDLLTVIGFMLVFSSAPIAGVGFLFIAAMVWLWLCPDPYNINDLED